MVPELLQPKIPDYRSLACHEREMKIKQITSFDQCHKAHSLDPLVPGDLVWILQNQRELCSRGSAKVIPSDNPKWALKRNHQQLRLLPSSSKTTSEEDTTTWDNPDPGPDDLCPSSCYYGHFVFVAITSERSGLSRSSTDLHTAAQYFSKNREEQTRYSQDGGSNYRWGPKM